MESKTSLVYECNFGAVFKLKHDDRRVLALSVRQQGGNWEPATEISDETNVYKDLGLDQCAIVQVLRKDDEVKLKDLFTVTLDEAGDSTTAAKAAKEKVLGQLLEKILVDWLKKSGPLLGHKKGEPTILSPDELVGLYDLKDREAIKLAYASEVKEGATAESMPHLEKAIERFNEFMDKAVEATDELYWFEHRAPLADRIGYVILRNGRVAHSYIVLMS